MGLLGNIAGAAIAGGAEGLGEAGTDVGKRWSTEEFEKQKAEAADLRQQNLARLGATLQQQTHAANTETDINAAGRKISAQTPAMVAQREALGPIEAKNAGLLGTATAQAAVDVANDPKNVAARIKSETDAFTALAPIKRQEAIDTEVAKVRAMATPEMLQAVRSEALAKHIVDPAYTLIPNADGTVTTFDAHSGKSTGTLKGPDGQPVIRKDPEELKAATAVISMANANLRIAQAEYKAAASDMSGDPGSKARADAAWKNAQEESRRLTAPAYAVLYGKAGIEDKPQTHAEPQAQVPQGAIDALRKNPKLAVDFNSKYGGGKDLASDFIKSVPTQSKSTNVASPDAESIIPPVSIGKGRPNPAYQEFISSYGAPPAKSIGQGRRNPAYEEWSQKVLAGR